ncbi:hypothetical protein ACLMJK_001160 [Lecanora helva]
MHWTIPFLSTLLLSILVRANVANNSCSSAAPTLPKPIAFKDTPKLFANAASRQSADTVAQILNTLSLYPLSVDGKDFDSLSLVFTDDAIVNLSAPLGVATPLSAIKTTIAQSLAPVDSQHAYGTQIVNIVDECRAQSISYFTASQFGRGNYAGQVLYSYAQYQDNLIKTPANEWRIQTRNLVYMGPNIGNISVFTPMTS